MSGKMIRKIGFIIVIGFSMITNFMPMNIVKAEEKIDIPENIKPQYEIVDSDVLSENVETVSMNNVEQDPDVIQLEVPTRLPFMIDPYEIAEKGQVYSAEFKIKNKKEIPIQIDITKIECEYNDKEIELTQEEISPDDSSEEKKISLAINWNSTNGEKCKTIISNNVQENVYSVVLHGDEEITFYITGTVTTMNKISWSRNDIGFKMSYECTKLDMKNSVSENSVSENSVSENSVSENSISENSVENDFEDNDKDNEIISSVSQNNVDLNYEEQQKKESLDIQNKENEDILEDVNIDEKKLNQQETENEEQKELSSTEEKKETQKISTPKGE